MNINDEIFLPIRPVYQRKIVYAEFCKKEKEIEELRARLSKDIFSLKLKLSKVRFMSDVNNHEYPICVVKWCDLCSILKSFEEKYENIVSRILKGEI